MDPKKNLTPELKQIYDRVMNTQVKKPEANPATTSAPSSPPPVSTADPLNTTVNPIPSPMQATVPSPPPPPSNPNPGVSPVSDPQTNEAFLSSVPPRPLTDTKPFVFTGNKISSPQVKAETGNQAHASSNKKISGKIVAMLIVVLIVVWTLFWAKFFKLV